MQNTRPQCVCFVFVRLDYYFIVSYTPDVKSSLIKIKFYQMENFEDLKKKYQDAKTQIERGDLLRRMFGVAVLRDHYLWLSKCSVSTIARKAKTQIKRIDGDYDPKPK